ncbi:MAG: hypothetical protein P4L82_19635 [Ancalomicrobiaceae bacterium]|nr:hypothetical protein [Ancalomicrobiaceae bacterium]
MRRSSPLMPFLAAAALAVAASAVALPASADTSPPTPDAPLGLVDGKPAPYACFIRRYDADHLADHPKQNVTQMTVFISADSPEAGQVPTYQMTVGVYFRGVDKRFDVSGSCFHSDDPGQLLGCGVDCDGGRIGVRQKGADAVLVDIPNGARVGDPENEAPKAARFGSDDITFLLNRTSVRDCLAVVPDPDLKARIRKGK